jgi:hypothetical protein
MRPRWRRFAGAAVLASAPVNAVGLTALIAMFVAFGLGERGAGLTLGRTNDLLGILGTALMLPAVIEIHAVTGPERSVIRGTLAVVGIAAMTAIIWLQVLLVTERLPFEVQVRYVGVAYLFLALWFVGSGWTASRAGVMRHGERLGAAGALYFGQPLWAWRWARRLLDDAAAGTVSRAAAVPAAESVRSGAD